MDIRLYYTIKGQSVAATSPIIKPSQSCRAKNFIPLAGVATQLAPGATVVITGTPRHPHFRRYLLERLAVSWCRLDWLPVAGFVHFHHTGNMGDLK